MDVKLLGIYLNDHLAGSQVGLDVARRAERENRGNPLGDYLASLIPELEQDRAMLLQVLRSLRVPRDTLKQSAAWVLEKLGRLKLNGRLMHYSPLSRFVELEGLCLGTQGRRSMWRALRRLARTEPHLARFDFEALVARTEMQLKALERWRLQAADTAFSHARFAPTNLFPAESPGR
ncbi:MAG: hypothetical protein ACJ8AT_34445 [Hyalangium sp.]|uniref:hypothetical protein n=1 Tax=Hyalangium sp. TaxID=2028555 RepID=UPI003899BC43